MSTGAAVSARVCLLRVRAASTRLCCALLLTLTGMLAAADDVPVHHYRLHIECEGAGQPVVVFDAGLGGSSMEWVFVHEQVRRVTRSCVFDRAGYGASDMGPRPRTSSRIVNELYLLLEGAGERGPYVLVGHSFGGYNVQLFARRYPYLAAGVVLIDASHPEQVERFLEPPLSLLTAPSSRFGIVQFSDPPPPHAALPELSQREIARRARRFKTRRTLGSELLSFRESARELRMTPARRGIPLFVITRGRRDPDADDKLLLLEERWLEMQVELAQTSDYSAHLVARNAGHHIHIEQPQLVAYGVATLVGRHREEVRARRPDAGDGLPPVDFAAFPVRDATWLHDSLGGPETEHKALAQHRGDCEIGTVCGGAP